MLKKPNFLINSLLLVLVMAFVMRPVAVYLQNGTPHSLPSQDAKAFAQQASSPHSTFRNIEREAPDVTVYVPGISKVKVPSPLVSRSNFVFAASSPFLKSSAVLRI